MKYHALPTLSITPRRSEAGTPLQGKRLARVLALPLLLLTSPLLAQEGNFTTPDAAWVWNLVIALIVLATTAASAALPLAALKQWHGSWRIGAILPLLILIVWVGLIMMSRLGDGQDHRLWPLEIFAWAMLNMIYMVAIMTAKKIFMKHDEENAASS